MIQVKANRIYQLMKTDNNNGLFVYCLKKGEPNIGVILSYPEAADKIHKFIVSNDINKAKSFLESSYKIVFFYDSEVLTIYNEPLEKTLSRTTCEINTSEAVLFPDATHYSNFKQSRTKKLRSDVAFSISEENKEDSNSINNENFEERTQFFLRKFRIYEISVPGKEQRVQVYMIGTLELWKGKKRNGSLNIGIPINNAKKEIPIINSMLYSNNPEDLFAHFNIVSFANGKIVKNLPQINVSDNVRIALNHHKFESIEELYSSSLDKKEPGKAGSDGWRVLPQNRIVKLKHKVSSLAFYAFNIANTFYYKAGKVENSFSIGFLLPPNEKELFDKAKALSDSIQAEPDTFLQEHPPIITFRQDDRAKNFTAKTVKTFSLPPVVSDYLLQEVHKGNTLTYYDSVIYNGERIYNYMYSSNAKLSNCFVELKDGRLAFLLKGTICLPASVPPDSKRITIVRPSSNLSFDVTKWVSPSQIQSYGIGAIEIANKLYSRIAKLSVPLEKKIPCNTFFEKLNKIKEHPRVAPIYNRLFEIDEYNWDSYNRTIPILLKYVLDESLLVNTEGQKQVFGSTVPEKVVFDYKTYKGTHGIFYSLKNEEAIFSDGVSLKNIQCRFIKKFAYVPSSNRLSEVLDMLVADVDLVSRTLTTEVYKGKEIKKAVYPIRVDSDNFTFDFIPEASEVIRPIINTVALICNTIFKSYEHTASSASRNSHYREPKTPYSGKSEVGVITYRSSFSVREYSTDEQGDKLSSPKGMHFRRGHWHSYWYGPHNSPNRVKKLKWVKETIVNRDSQNIIIEI